MFVSHSSKPNKDDHLAGLGLGTTLYNMLGINFANGLASGLDTLCPHAYGAKMFYLMGCYLNRARIIMTIAFIPIFFIFISIEELLLLIGQSTETAKFSSDFIRGCLPGVWIFFLLDALRRFLQAQGFYVLPLLTIIFTTALHPLWVYLFYVVLDKGPYGIGLAVSINNLTNLVIVTILAKYFSIKEAFFFINRDSFRGWKEFLVISVPSFLMTFLETLNYQINTIMSGYLHKDQFNSNIILTNMSFFFLCILLL